VEKQAAMIDEALPATMRREALRDKHGRVLIDDKGNVGAGVRTIGGIPRGQLSSAAVGNLIEWFDWNAYAFLSVYFAKQFFPANTSTVVALLGTFGIMAVGFLMRPIAGLVIGKIADLRGRRFAMLLTVYGMGIAALTMAVVPTYAQIGILAPLILLAARIIQGICIGGEYGAMSAFAMESSPRGKRGTVAGVLNAVAQSGQLAVTILVVGATLLLSATDMTEWGWRLIFGVGAALSIFGIWIRRNMVETASDKPAQKHAAGLFASFRAFPKQSLQVVGLTIGFTVMVYAWGSYIPAFAFTYKGVDPKLGLISTMISAVVGGIAALALGPVSDKFGRRKTMLAAGLVLAIGTVPAMNLITSFGTLITFQALAAVALGMLQVSSMPAYSELFPRQFRAAGLGFPYALTVGLVGGTAPLVGTQFAAWNIGAAFPWYLAVLMLISVVFYARMKETAYSPLPE